MPLLIAAFQEEQRKVLEAKASASTRRMTWLGVTALGVQFGVLARLTWSAFHITSHILRLRIRWDLPLTLMLSLRRWEYSWDLMEPVTYFVTFGGSCCLLQRAARRKHHITAVFYLYYLTSQREYNYEVVADRHNNKKFYQVRAHLRIAPVHLH